MSFKKIYFGTDLYSADGEVPPDTIIIGFENKRAYLRKDVHENR